MEPSQDFKSLQENIQKALVSTVKTANRISAEDLAFQRTVSPAVGDQLDDRTSRLLDLSTRLLQSSARACGLKAPKLEDAEDVEMNWRGVVDVVDSVLEKADTAMDEYTGLVKRKEPPSTDSASKSKKPKSFNKVIRNANISKPQIHFQLQPDNFPTTPWKPLLTSKPHATLPLAKSLVTFTTEAGSTQYKHPYETEITQMEYPERVYQTADPIPYQPVETTHATWVDTYEGVTEMLEELKKAKEIAVDLEHHDFRTYVGLVSLMQISTRERDWIVDTLQPWRHKLEVLNEVFADPSIVKVFHGAYMDMVWLQRDLGLYVNGLFDTFSRAKYSIPDVAWPFCSRNSSTLTLTSNTNLPIGEYGQFPREMMYYARSDTHYLLYIYDNVRNDLVKASNPADPEANHIARALQRSRELSLSRHEHPGYDEETGEGSRGWYGYVFKHSHLAFDSEQFAVFRALWKWRDQTARKEDESPNYVLATPTIAEISRVNPPDAKALHSLLPLNSALARPRFNEIWNQLKEAKARGGPSLLHFFTSMSPDVLRKTGHSIVAKQHATKLPDIDGEVTIGRLAQSKLFGSMPISTRWEMSKQASSNQNDRVPFPWQRFVEQAVAEGAFEDEDEKTANDTPSKPEKSVAAPGPVDPAALQEALDEEFTLKRGQKRKSDVMDVEEDDDDDDEDDETSSSGEDEDDEQEENTKMDEDEEMADDNGVISILDEPKNKGLTRQQRKKERKAQEKLEAKQEQLKRQEAKLARQTRHKEKKQKQKEDKGQDKKYDAVPFDYSKASSVLHASRDASATGPVKKRVFDPYSKSTDTGLIKGARKAPPVRGERSATFKK